MKLKKRKYDIPCSLCGKLFDCKENLKYHMNVHSGAKPYQCFFCETSFQNKSNRINHMKKSHPDLHQKKKKQDEESLDQVIMTFVQ